MINKNQFGFTLLDLTYIFAYRQKVLILDEDLYEIYSGEWYKCSCMGDYEVTDIGLVIGEGYEDYIHVIIKTGRKLYRKVEEFED